LRRRSAGAARGHGGGGRGGPLWAGGGLLPAGGRLQSPPPRPPARGPGGALQGAPFGQESSFSRPADIDMPNDPVRLRAIRGLIERGHLSQILISHDICYLSRLVRWGGHGYGHIFDNVV